MKIFRDSDRDKVLREAMKGLNGCLRENRSKPILLMLSGGSALELLAGIDMRWIGKHITVTVLDERFSQDPAVNNFSQLAETEFYKKAERKGVDYIDTRVHGKVTLQGLAKKFASGLKKWKRRYLKKGKIIITQGVGQDGHTAGIMGYPANPKKFQQLFENEEKWVVGYTAKGKTQYPLRITVTLPFLRNEVDCAVVYVTGFSKERALKRVLAKEGTLARTPARIVHEMKGVKLFTDI